MISAFGKYNIKTCLMQTFSSKLVSVAEQVGLGLTQMETPKTNFLRMWPIFIFSPVVQEQM